jgi:hypothetical protein
VKNILEEYFYRLGQPASGGVGKPGAGEVRVVGLRLLNEGTCRPPYQRAFCTCSITGTSFFAISLKTSLNHNHPGEAPAEVWGPQR